MKQPFLVSATSIALLAAAVFALTSVAQSPPPASGKQPPPGGAPPPEIFPEPKNLRVLPRSLSGKQVHEIMHEWSGGLGVRCNTCHAIDPDTKGPDGKPLLNYADDSKEEKRTARVMAQMLEEINVNYVSKVPNSDMPVTCGTCHRGNLDPEPFIVQHPHGPHSHDEPPPIGASKPAKH